MLAHVRCARVIGLFAALLLLGGCNKKEQPIEPPQDEVAAKPAAAAAPAAEEKSQANAADVARTAGPVVVTDSYELRAVPAGPYKAGELGRFDVTLASKGKWHINQDYPTEVSVVQAPGITLPKKKLAKSDAAAFGEHQARFEVPLTPDKAGDHEVTADVSFAVCTDQTCLPQQQQLALLLPVE